MIDPNCFELTMEQQFDLRSIEIQSSNLSLEQARGLLLQTTRLLMVKDNIIKHLIEEVH